MINALHDLVMNDPPGELRAVPADLAEMPTGCLLDILDIRLTHVGRGRCRAEMKVGEAHLNQRGLPQGGALVALADAAAGWASYAALPEGRFTTLELKSNLLGRVEAGTTLVAIATPVHLGRQTLVIDVEVLRAEYESADPPRRLVSRFSCTQLVLGG
jgi:1,4-dihydroxy-2-naphthoyl-CoA hydrolase